MTTVQTMFTGAPGLRAALAALLLLVPACARKPGLTTPQALVSPYGEREVLWAIAPLANESGTTQVDVLAIGDALSARITEVDGLSAAPTNRTLAAMQALGLSAVRSPADAQKLAAALGVNGLIVGAVTSYDPYNPPKLGLTLALYERPTGPTPARTDPRALSGAFSDGPVPGSQFPTRPASVVSENLDGANHEVQLLVRGYAQGRHDAEAALGWRRYLASMDLYTEFAAHHAVRRLLESESQRLGAGPVVRPAAGSAQR